MENCKHERCYYYENTQSPGWYLDKATRGDTTSRAAYRVTFCPDCGARLEPPKPEVMTLEEVAAEMRAIHSECVGPFTLQAWHRSITAHIEGEPRGLTAEEIEWLWDAEGKMYIRGLRAESQRIGIIAARHTKGGKQA